MKENVPEEVKEEFIRGSKILKKGEKYYCTECHSEVPIKKSLSYIVKLSWIGTAYSRNPADNSREFQALPGEQL